MGNSEGRGTQHTSAERPPKGITQNALDSISSIQAPHGYFVHFYIFSVLLSLFWGIQILCRGSLLGSIANRAGQGHNAESMSLERIILLWALFLIQGARRLAETILVMRTSASSMWFVHYLLGMGFYFIMSVAIWIEGAGKAVLPILLRQVPIPTATLLKDLSADRLNAGTLLATRSPIQDIAFSPPSKRTLLCIPVFIIASGIQHDCHVYLASLPKYTLPTHPIFQLVVCPHYSAECLIYMSMAILGAPRGAWINKTLASALLFVLANLGVTASTSKEWYARKFGKEKITGRWNMIPFLY